MKNTILIFALFVAICYGQTNVFGTVSGTWDIWGSPYNVIDDINVPTDDTLIVDPGVEVLFQGPFSLSVDSNAVFKAVGLEHDSIFFLPIDSIDGWEGIEFYKSSNACSLTYCDIEYAIDSTEGGGAIYCRATRLSLANCKIVNNIATAGGGVVFSYCDSLSVNYNTITNNSAISGRGGAISFGNCDFVYFKGNIIKDNSSSSGAGGINITTGFMIIEENLICSNVSDFDGGGIWAGEDSYLILVNNYFVRNSARYGGAIYSGVLQLTNNTIALNEATDGCAIYNATLISFNNTFMNYSSELKSCEGAIAYSYIDPTACFACDIDWGYGNIFSDPVFADTSSDDFHLTLDSPCKDEGVHYIVVDSDTFFAPGTDYDGDLRPLYDGYDMGADEYFDEDIFGIEVYRGWNLFSIPTIGTRSRNIAPLPVYEYNRDSVDYVVLDSLKGGYGYWSLGTETDTIFTLANLSDYSDTLYRGWNLIGSINDTIPISHISTSPVGLGVLPVFGWDVISSEYHFADSIYPGKGYWFLSNGNGRIHVGP